MWTRVLEPRDEQKLEEALLPCTEEHSEGLHQALVGVVTSIDVQVMSCQH